MLTLEAGPKDRGREARAAGRAPATAPRPVRIAFLIDELSRAGVETQLLALIDRLDRSQVQPYLCLLRGDTPSSRELEPDACPVMRLGVRSLRSFRALRRAWQLARFLRRERIDVLQVHFPDSTYLGVLAGCLARVPHIVRTRDSLGYALRPIDIRLGRLCNRVTDYTIANCAAVRDSLLADEGPRPETLVVLETGVDLTRFAVVPTFDTFATEPTVGIVANLRPVKCLDLFLKAAAEVARTHPRVRFAVGGDGEQREELEALARQLGLADRCRFHGAVSDVPAFLAGLDVCVLSSRSEGMPNAILEYMACGRPVVATAVGANGQLLGDDERGLLVPPGDVGALAGALRRFLDDPGLAARLGEAARRHVEERYSKDRCLERYQSFYMNLARGPTA